MWFDVENGMVMMEPNMEKSVNLVMWWAFCSMLIKEHSVTPLMERTVVLPFRKGCLLL